MTKKYGLEFYPIAGAEHVGIACIAMSNAGFDSWYVLDLYATLIIYNEHWELMCECTPPYFELKLVEADEVREMYVNQKAADWDIPKEVLEVLNRYQLPLNTYHFTHRQ